MRTQNENPMFNEFRDLLPDDGLYPAAWVDIFSNTSRDPLRIKDVEVVFVPRGIVPTPITDEIWDQYAAYNKPWSGDLGNSLSDWLQPGGHTPATVFGFFLRMGFASEGELHNALKEFAHIKECDWAREMLEAYERG